MPQYRRSSSASSRLGRGRIEPGKIQSPWHGATARASHARVPQFVTPDGIQRHGGDIGTSCPPAPSGFTDQFATGELWIGLENLFSELCVANSE
jgi:hypothetical protein